MSSCNFDLSIRDGATYFAKLAEVMSALPVAEVDAIASRLMQAYEASKTVFLFGNGGSAALASHFACDLGKGTVIEAGQQRLRVIALTDNIPTLTAWANDSDYEDIFAEPLKSLVAEGDVAVAVSGSGNSRNVLRALEVARERGAFTIGFGGFAGGRMKALCDLCLVVPSENMQHIEDLHLCIAHAVFTIVRHRIQERLAAMTSIAAAGAR